MLQAKSNEEGIQMLLFKFKPLTELEPNAFSGGRIHMKWSIFLSKFKVSLDPLIL